MTYDMTTILEVPPEVDGVPPEEIEISIEQHADLMNATPEGLNNSTNNGLNGIFFDTDVWFEDPVDDEGSANKEDIFVNLSAEKPRKVDSDQKTSKLPPTIALATTFDTEPTSSVSGDEFSTASPDVNIQELMSDFSSLSVLEVSAIMEEQEKGRDLSKVEEIQREQEQIDQGLQLLVEEEDEDDESEMIADSAEDFGNNNETNLEKQEKDLSPAHVEEKAISTSTSDETASGILAEEWEDAPLDELQGRLSKTGKSKHKQPSAKGYLGLFKLFVVATATTGLVAIGRQQS